MEQLSAPLEGVVVIVVDTPADAKRIEKALSNAGAAVFLAQHPDEIRRVFETVSPHFAVIDPASAGGTGPHSAGWMLFGHVDCRAIVYSSGVHQPQNAEVQWLIDKARPVSNVVDAILTAVSSPNWVHKGGDDVKPAR